MTSRIKKLYRGLVDLRSYNVDTCISKNENYTVLYEEFKMILSPEQLKNERLATSNKIESIYEADPYYLYSYKWNPINNKK